MWGIHKKRFTNNPDYNPWSRECEWRDRRRRTDPKIIRSKNRPSLLLQIDSARFHFLFIHHPPVTRPTTPAAAFTWSDWLAGWALCKHSIIDSNRDSVPDCLDSPNIHSFLPSFSPSLAIPLQPIFMSTLDLHSHTVVGRERLGKLQWQFVWIANKFNDSDNYRGGSHLQSTSFSSMSLAHSTSSMSHYLFRFPRSFAPLSIASNRVVLCLVWAMWNKSTPINKETSIPSLEECSIVCRI